MMRLTKKDGRFNEVYFAIQAMSKDKIKPVINSVYADEKNIVCTDSRRLHKIENNELLEPGFYEVLTYKKSEIVLVKMDEEPGQFPNYNQVIPEHGKIFKLTEWDCNKISDYPKLIVEFHKHFSYTLALNYDFLRCLDDKFTVYSEGMLCAVLFESDKKVAVIMPLHTH